MANYIKGISDSKFTINGKLVYMDMNNNWHGKHLTEKELETASAHIAALNNLQNHTD